MQVFAWIATFWKGRVQVNAPTLFLLGFIFIFVLGGLTGVMVAVLPFDWQVHDTYFVVAHLHYVLIGGMVFPLFAGLYYWTPLLNGHRLSERVGALGVLADVRRLQPGLLPDAHHRPARHAAPRLHLCRRPGLETLEPAVDGRRLHVRRRRAAVLRRRWRTLRRPEQPHGNPWNAATLEWLPAREYGMRSIPQVASREPLWDQPDLPAEVEAGRHWLPGTPPAGARRWSPARCAAELRHLLLLPGDGWLPFVAAAGTAGFFLLLTVHWVCARLRLRRWWRWPPIIGLAVGLRPAAAAAQRAGRRHGAAAGGRRRARLALVVGHGRAAVVDATIFASLAFAHVHVSMAPDVCPPPGAALPAGATGHWHPRRPWRSARC